MSANNTEMGKKLAKLQATLSTKYRVAIQGESVKVAVIGLTK